MSDCTLQAILTQAIETPSYTPPMTLKRLGELLYLRAPDTTPDRHWPAPVRRGWLAMLRASADAETSAFLVAQGGAR